MTTLEEELREAFAGESASLPPLHPDPAAGAMRRATRIRRTRAAGTLGGVAAVLVFAVSLGAVATARPEAGLAPAKHGPTAPRRTQKSGLDVDMLMASNALWTTDGRRLSLRAESESVSQAYRVPGGWIYESWSLGGGSHAERVRFLRPDGTVSELLRNVLRYEVSPDGRRIAWVTKKAVHEAHLVDGRLVDQRDLSARDDVRPVTWLGDHVVLTIDGSCCGSEEPYRPARWAVWNTRGGFDGRWTENVGRVYGPSADGKSLIGIVRTGAASNATAKGAESGVRDGCLALLDPAHGLSATQKNCTLGLSPDSTWGSLSPGGKRFFDATADGGAMFDVGTLFTGSNAAKPMALPDAAGRPVWEDENTALVPTDGGLARCTMGSATGLELADVGGYALVPRRGA